MIRVRYQPLALTSIVENASFHYLPIRSVSVHNESVLEYHRPNKSAH